jgi:hypothetical protein
LFSRTGGSSVRQSADGVLPLPRAVQRIVAVLLGF